MITFLNIYIGKIANKKLAVWLSCLKKYSIYFVFLPNFAIFVKINYSKILNAEDMKPIFRTDIYLLLFFVLTLVTGIKVHYASHYLTHDAWHNWSLAHFSFAVLMLVTACIHIRQHWGWFKSFTRSATLQRKITTIVTILFVLTVLSGTYLLLFVEGQYSAAGVAHFWIGIVFGVFAIGHFIRRFKVFKKGVTEKKS